MRIFVKNQLNDGLSIEFCCGDKEYCLDYDEEKVIDVEEDDCLYFDVVCKPSKVLSNV